MLCSSRASLNPGATLSPPLLPHHACQSRGAGSCDGPTPDMNVRKDALQRSQLAVRVAVVAKTSRSVAFRPLPKMLPWTMAAAPSWR